MMTKPPAVRIGRSPNYPGLSLPEAAEKAKSLWQAQRAHPTPVKAIRGYLGYTGDSGTARRALSALIQYGLLVEEGKGEGEDRLLKVTEEARKLILLPEGGPEAMAIIRELMMRPKIYAEMINKWPNGLPTDQQIQIFLTVEKKYQQETAPSLIRNFRRSYAYAGLGASEDSANDFLPDEASSATNGSQGEENSSPSGYRGTTAYTLPIGGARNAYLHIPPDMTAKDFKMLAKAIDLVRMSVLDEDDDTEG